MTSTLPGFFAEKDALIPSRKHYRTPGRINLSGRADSVVQPQDSVSCLARCATAVMPCITANDPVQCLIDKGAYTCLSCLPELLSEL